MVNDFIEALKPTSKKFYRAYCLLKDGRVGVSPSYSFDILKMWLEDTKKSYVKVLDIREDIEK